MVLGNHKLPANGSDSEVTHCRILPDKLHQIAVEQQNGPMSNSPNKISFRQDTDGDSNCNELASQADSKECRNDALACHIDGQVTHTCSAGTVTVAFWHSNLFFITVVCTLGILEAEIWPIVPESSNCSSSWQISIADSARLLRCSKFVGYAMLPILLFFQTMQPG